MSKFLFDKFFSLFAIILFSPIFLIISILIKLDSGPIFFLQKRVGFNNREFKIYKFRSMVVDADKKGSFQTKKNDKRVTKIGRFIRKTSIDELPQLINVLKGDMSLVGPRPNVIGQLDDYDESDWNRRHKVKPGITGLAQATKRSSATFEERLYLDLLYVDKNNFFVDLEIIFLTIKQVFRKGGF